MKILITLLSFCLSSAALFSQNSDIQAPTVICLYGYSRDLPPEAAFDFEAYNFYFGAYDNVTPTSQIRLGVRFAGAGTGFPRNPDGSHQKILHFDCSTLDTQYVELWAMDQAGNAAFCTTYLIVKDPLLLCDNSQPAGSICTRGYCGWNDRLLETGYLFLPDSSGAQPFEVSQFQQCLLLDEYVPILPDYTIAPYLNDYQLEGVDAGDLTALSRHIRGIQPFTQPWQWVAADANRDNVVDVQDSVELSRLIQGVYQKLPNNSSWRFVRSDYLFPAGNPLSQPFPESVRGADLNASSRVKFYGIKIGDLNQNCLGVSPVSEPEFPVQPRLYPNPTDAGATLAFSLPQSARVQLEVFDFSSRVMLKVAQQLPAGEQKLAIPAEALPEPGMYFWRLQTGNRQVCGKVVRM